MGLEASLDVVEKSRQCTYNIILWGVCETYVAMEITAMHSLCIVELHVTANYNQILNDAQHCFYGNFCHQQKLSIRWSSSKVPNTALRQKNVCLFMAFIICAVWLNRL